MGDYRLEQDEFELYTAIFELVGAFTILPGHNVYCDIETYEERDENIAWIIIHLHSKDGTI